MLSIHSIVYALHSSFVKLWSVEMALYHLVPQGNGHTQCGEKTLAVTRYFVIFVHIGCIKVVVE